MPAEDSPLLKMYLRRRAGEDNDIELGVDEIRKKQEGRRLSSEQVVARLESVPTKSRIEITITNSTRVNAVCGRLSRRI